MVEPEFDHPFTLERTLHLAATMQAATEPARPDGGPAPAGPLDTKQLAAVSAGDGVVQIIAPAGSGKTTVLIERVRELLRRGCPPSSILCLTFNRAAADEMRRRLVAAGVSGVDARTYHSIGRGLLAEEGLLRGRTDNLSPGQWKRLSAMANKETGTWVDPADARAHIGAIKLSHLATADEWRHLRGDDPESIAVSAIYSLYEREMQEKRAHDFDDQIMLAVRALRSDARLRSRWQRRFSRVLVDEYQDIEPAQELLVQILAAPEDSLFAVGDEDQTLYGWRRASVMRIVGLDQAYPSLQRVALETNYRCPPRVVARSAELVTHNALRFPKSIRPAPGRVDDPEAISLHEFGSPESAADWAAGRLAASSRGQIVVLARTTRQLRTVALACIGPRVRISAPEAIFEARGAQAAIEAHLRLAVGRAEADPEDVQRALRTPARGLTPGAEQQIVERLHRGASWRAAVAGAGDATRMEPAADLLDALAVTTDAAAFVRTLRGRFGLDRHFAEYEKTFGGAEQVETEALADAEAAARGQTVVAYAAQSADRRDALLHLRDDEHGVELATVHSAKGREWPTVIVFGFDQGQLPHRKALEVTPEAQAAGEGEQAERRVAYVALTRAMERLHLCHTKGKVSPFAWQAGLAEPPPPPSTRRTAPTPSHRSRSEATRRPMFAAAASRGPRDAIRETPDRAAGLHMAARAISGDLGDCERATLEDLLIEAPSMNRKRARGILEEAGASLDTRVRTLDVPARARIAAAVLTAADQP